MVLNKSNRGIVLATQIGFVITEDGRLYYPNGLQKEINICESATYPLLTFRDQGEKYTMYIHRLAAYQFYGESIFQPGIVVRHLDGNLYNISQSNIVLGTQMENISDKKSLHRVGTKRKVPPQTLYVPDCTYLETAQCLSSLKWLSKSQRELLRAYLLGYRVTKHGVLLKPNGEQKRPNPPHGKTKYPYFKIDKYTPMILVHRLAAFCFYGPVVFVSGIVTRHLTSNVLDFSMSNITTGTQADNIGDIPNEVRREIQRKGNRIATERKRRIKDKEKVLEIRQLHLNGSRPCEIASKLEIPYWLAYRIINGSYADIQ